MKLHRPVVAALALFVGLPTLGLADADAAFIRRSAVKEVTNQNGSTFNRVIVVVGDDNTTTSVGVELASDAGDEELPLIETDAWVHGAATISALPTADAGLTVTLYDAGSAALMSFSGTLGADGSVTLTPDTTKYDVELLAADVFTAEKGYDVGLDLAGADTYAVAYATLTVTEGGAVCLATDEKGNCLKWDTTKEVSTRSEVYWDEIGSVWEAETTLAHEGLIELKATTRDSGGKKIEAAKAKLGAPWLDDGEGVGTLATDEDPLTRLALHRREFRASISMRVVQTTHLTVVSEGWTAGDDIPLDAEVELTNGTTITIPVNSYQRKGDLFKIGDEVEATVLSIDRDERLRFQITDTSTGSTVEMETLSDTELYEPMCTDGYCVVLSEDADGLSLSVSAYSGAAAVLPDEAEIVVSVVDTFGKEQASESHVFAFADELTAVFSNEVSFASDPVGLGLSGKVKLLGAPNRKGKQETLAKGKFYAELTRDGDGDLELGGGEKDTVVSSGSAVQAGEAIGLEDSEGGLAAPPVIVYAVTGNGSGTKNASSQTSIKPQLF